MRILFLFEVLLKKMVKTCLVCGEEEKRTKNFYLQFKLPLRKLYDFTSKVYLQRLGNSSPATDKNFPKSILQNRKKKSNISIFFIYFQGMDKKTKCFTENHHLKK